jgi:hypothetical protein
MSWWRHFDLTKPTKKTVIVFCTVYFIGTFLTLMAASDLFTENPFQRRYLPVLIMTAAATIVTVNLVLRYFKSSRK